MRDGLEAIIRYIVGEGDTEGLAGINISSQFDGLSSNEINVLKNLNAAFLIVLSGGGHPLSGRAREYLAGQRDGFEEIVDFYLLGLEVVPEEFESVVSDDETLRNAFDLLLSRVNGPSHTSARMETIENVRKVFFPEGVSICLNAPEMTRLLREKRKVAITHLNPSPLNDPAKEVLFTSNVLLTVPSRSMNVDALDMSEELRSVLKDVAKEKQLYWYDHPIQIGVDTGRNEAIYGIKNLAGALEFEKRNGSTAEDARLTCVLSLSVTHEGLQWIGKRYLEEEFGKAGGFKDIDVYVFTEVETGRLIDEIVLPALEHYMGITEDTGMREVLGVDGEYGRHYTFLKAVSAFWQIFMDSDKKGTFKIDLDQVFPQRELVDQTGLSAFGHMRTPLWGAEGIDNNSDPVELGMIAGALVNEKDIDHSLFVPDVCYPPTQIRGDELIFHSLLPQALSTEAEMMTRYGEGAFDGEATCIQRVHVTGGTNGILNGHLRKHRPFTPVFIGRAEDQAYLLSVLFAGGGAKLRYAHKDGLVMRHDKEAFAGDSIKAAAVGKLIGDYARILWFSAYAKALPWSLKDIKKLMDPFTGCFISRMPLTLVYMRFALRAAVLFSERSEEKSARTLEYMRTGPSMLIEIIDKLTNDREYLAREYHREKRVWDMYYDALDHVEKGITLNDPFALELRDRARALAADCRINT